MRLGPIRRASVSRPNSLTCLLREIVHTLLALPSSFPWHLLSLQLCKHHLSPLLIAQNLPLQTVSLTEMIFPRSFLFKQNQTTSFLNRTTHFISPLVTLVGMHPIHQILCRTQWPRVGNNIDSRDSRFVYGYVTLPL